MKICNGNILTLGNRKLWSNFKLLLLLPTIRQNTVCLLFLCHTLSNCMRRNVIVPEQCYICYNFTINCFDGSGTKMQFVGLHRLNIGCLVIARNVSATMAANHSICDVQLFQFKKPKMKQFSIELWTNQIFFFEKTAFFSIKWARTDNGDTHWNYCTQVNMCTFVQKAFILHLCTADTSQSTEFWCESIKINKMNR